LTKQMKPQTDLGAKAASLVPMENRNALAVRVSERIGIPEATALGRIARFPSLVRGGGGVLYHKQRPSWTRCWRPPNPCTPATARYAAT